MPFTMFLLFGYFLMFCYFYHFFIVIQFELEPKEFAANTVFNIIFACFGFIAAKIMI